MEAQYYSTELQSNSYVTGRKTAQTIKQYDSNISLVFKLFNTEDRTSLFLKSFSRESVIPNLDVIELCLKEQIVQLSLYSSYKMAVSHTIFHVFRGLHHINRKTAQVCLIDFLGNVKKAVDERHKHDVTHLNIRLPNVCLRKRSD